jgi:SPP1 family predicted phage head-tail adaptor
MGALRAGDLDRRITIERPAAAQNGFGEDVPSWAEVATVWASKRDLTGAEYFRAASINAEITTRFRLRYLAGLTADMRIVIGSEIYVIASIAELGRREGLEIMAVRRQ